MTSAAPAEAPCWYLCAKQASRRKLVDRHTFWSSPPGHVAAGLSGVQGPSLPHALTGVECFLSTAA